ncbi:hypothetical protein N7454_006011 [Penicillium verhagenii]|nr:hypothetical protein N7454_006011 [Penicillium verhagenii]
MIALGFNLAKQCDKQVPHCGQCIRTREACPGYRDEWDLVFRDQTSDTIKRSRKVSEKKHYEIHGAATDVNALTIPISGPNPNLVDLGVNYFLQDFVVGGQYPSCGFLNYIPTAYSADAEHPTLLASMAAVGLVALAARRPELVRHARAKYSEAIQRVNDALSSPVDSLKDSTLMSVISLGVFEHVSNFESWVRHVKGAATLVVARGKSQFARRNAILMFNQVRADMSAACIHRVRPFPNDMLELQEEAAKYIDPSDAFWALGVLATRCATVFALAARKNNGIRCSESWFDFLKASIAIEDDFEFVLDVLAKQEPYKIIQESCERTRFISYNGRYHLYRTSWAIRLWNNSRMVEIIVCRIICWLIDKVLEQDMPYSDEGRVNLESKRQEAIQIMSRRGKEILATVPQGLGLVFLPSANKPEERSVSGGYMLIWNLYTVGKSPAISYQNRRWVVKQLKGISESAGITMALQLAEDVVRIDQEVYVD